MKVTDVEFTPVLLSYEMKYLYGIIKENKVNEQ